MAAIIISFSGIDGSGKTTYAQQTVEVLSRLGYSAEYCKQDYTVNEIMKKFCENEYGDPFSYIPNLNGNVYIYGLLLDIISRFPHPTKSYFIDIEPANANERLRTRKSPPIHHLESLENLEILQDCYQDVFSTLPWNRTHIPAGIPVEEVVKGLMLEFQDQMPKYKRAGENG